MVDATALFSCVMIKTPKKLNAALIKIAPRTLRQRVVTQVAIAFGASVQPFTKITPSVKRTIMQRMGFPAISCQKYENDTSIKAPF